VRAIESRRAALDRSPTTGHPEQCCFILEMAMRTATHVSVVLMWLWVCTNAAFAQIDQKVVDIPTRPGVTQRMVVLSPPQPRAAVVLFAGGHGGLQVYPNGSMKWGEGNFVVRTRRLFAEQGLLVAVVDAPSDRRDLGGFRQSPEHAEDIRAVIAWLRAQASVPVWLLGTSRGTQSAAAVALHLPGAEGPDGLVLTSTMLADDKGRPVPEMPLRRLRVPVLVVHHEQDGCRHCAFADIGKLTDKLDRVPRQQLLTFKGGLNQGDPCEAMAYHGFNGLEGDVVGKIAAWITTKQ
jgi:dienelactone hydrolase